MVYTLSRRQPECSKAAAILDGIAHVDDDLLDEDEQIDIGAGEPDR